jgi:hypothetical protein
MAAGRDWPYSGQAILTKGRHMKKIAVLFTLASFIALPAWGQAKPEAKPQAAKETAAPAVMAEGGRKSRRNEDARHCLEKASNTEIIKCAEAFL